MEYFSHGRKPRKSRLGSVPVNIETLMKQIRHEKGKDKVSALQFQAFSLAMQEKLAGDVTAEEAMEAVEALRKKPGIKKHLEFGALGGGVSPVISVARGATQGFVDTPGRLRARLGGAAKGVARMSRGELAASAVGGGLTGAALSAGREGLQLRKAKKTVHNFLGTPGKWRARRRIERALKGD